MALLEKCPMCPLSTRPGKLIGGLCDYHRKNGGELHKVPDNVSVQTVKAPVIEKESEKLKALNKQYLKMRIPFLEANPFCMMDLPGCTKRADQVHHGKGRGKYLLVQSTWVPCCPSCHEWATVNSAQAIEMGISERRNTAV